MATLPTTRTASLSALICCALTLTLAACATTEEEPQLPPDMSLAQGAIDVIPKTGGEEQIDAVIQSVDHQSEAPVASKDQEVGDEITHARTGEIPLELNDDVERWISFFTVQDQERFQRFLERGEKYRPMITA